MIFKLRRRARTKRQTALLALAWVLILAGVSGIAWAFITAQKQPQQPPASASSGQHAPSAKKPTKSAVETYNVAPDLPKFISIPAIHVTKARIIQLGVTKNNQIATPGNIYDAGWYNGSAKPGAPGAMFIFGHVSSWQANGVFFDLKKLKKDDTITVTRGDNKTFTYTVASSKIYPADKVDMKTVLAPVDSSKPGLNLMTCAGQVIKGTSEFNERLVVFTSQTSPTP